MEFNEKSYTPDVWIFEIDGDRIGISMDGAKYYFNGRNYFRMDEFGDLISIRKDTVDDRIRAKVDEVNRGIGIEELRTGFGTELPVRAECGFVHEDGEVCFICEGISEKDAGVHTPDRE